MTATYGEYCPMSRDVCRRPPSERDDVSVRSWEGRARFPEPAPVGARAA
jgi:hypothetical protein